MIQKIHSANEHWLEVAKSLQIKYEKQENEEAIQAGRASIERIEKTIQKLEEQGGF